MTVPWPSRDVRDVISGCRYSPKENLAKFSYLLINGTIRINYTNINFGTAGTTSFFFPSTYMQKGYFQCVIYDPLRMKAPVVSNSSVYFSLKSKLQINFLIQIIQLITNFSLFLNIFLFLLQA